VNATGQQRLNAADRAMLTVDRVLRGMGGQGFETQTLVWLSARLDVAALKAAVGRLSARHPVIAARVVEAGAGGPCWRFRPGAVCPLRETDLPSDNPAAVLEHASQLLAAPSDPAEVDPLRFHLLHRPDGQDVFLVQYSHALMDNNASVLLLQELDQLSRPVPDSPEAWPPLAPPSSSSGGEGGARGEGRDLVWEYLRRFPRERRRRAASSTARLWGRVLRGGIAALSDGAGRAVPAGVRIATRCLEPDATRALQAGVIKASGFPNLSMALAGSAFRAIRQLTPRQEAPGRGFLAGIGVDLGLRGRRGLILQNLVSLVPVGARPEDLEDRDRLLRMLSRQMRERLAGEADLGLLQLVALLGRHPRPDARWLVEHFLRHGFSLWYAYFGSLDAAGDSFCGAPVERVFYTGPAWSAVGLTLLVNQHRGRLFLQATCTPESVPEALAHRFLDHVVGDLAGWISP
jgi:hypothetical protein